MDYSIRQRKRVLGSADPIDQRRHFLYSGSKDKKEKKQLTRGFRHACKMLDINAATIEAYRDIEETARREEKKEALRKEVRTEMEREELRSEVLEEMRSKGR